MKSENMDTEVLLKNKWFEVKDDIQKLWVKLSTEELAKAKTHFKDFVRIICAKYDLKREQVKERLDQVLTKYKIPSTETQKFDSESPRLDDKPITPHSPTT